VATSGAQLGDDLWLRTPTRPTMAQQTPPTHISYNIIVFGSIEHLRTTALQARRVLHQFPPFESLFRGAESGNTHAHWKLLFDTVLLGINPLLIVGEVCLY
jgi:hypothetical protein